MSSIKALDLQRHDTKESMYGGTMTVWQTQRHEGGLLVKWDMGAPMDYLIAEAFYTFDRNPVFELTNR